MNLNPFNVLSKIIVNNILSLLLFFYHYYYFSRKIRLGISCDSSARKTIHKECQALFSLKNIKNISKCCLLHLCLALKGLINLPRIVI